MIHAFHESILSNSLTLNTRDFTDTIAARIPWNTLLNVTTIDLRNCGLTSIPAGLAKLNPVTLTSLRMEGNPLLGFHKTLVESRASVGDVIINLRESLDGKVVPFKELKVMVVGDPAVGKTSMLRVLYGLNNSGGSGSKSQDVTPPLATDGIDLGDVTLDGYRLTFWDFAGQEVYRYTHQLFLSDHAVCLLMYRMTSSDEEAQRQLTFWMDSVLQRAPNATCLLVGSHARSFPEEVAESRVKHQLEFLKDRFGERVCGSVAVDSLTFFGFANLKNALIQVASAKVCVREREKEKERTLFYSYVYCDLKTFSILMIILKLIEKCE